MCRAPSFMINVSPVRRSASRFAPRTMQVTLSPASASRAATNPPIAPQPTTAIFTGLVPRQRRFRTRRGARSRGMLPHAALFGFPHQLAQKSLLVDLQQVRPVALHVHAYEVAVVGGAEQIAEGRGIPTPGQFQLAEGAVVGLEFHGERVADNACHCSLLVRTLPSLGLPVPKEKLKVSIASICFL